MVLAETLTERMVLMTQAEFLTDYQEIFEYHGNTSVERVRKRGNSVLLRDWIFFDSVEEAEAFFHDPG
jgi:hypothetical protein